MQYKYVWGKWGEKVINFSTYPWLKIATIVKNYMTKSLTKSIINPVLLLTQDINHPKKHIESSGEVFWSWYERKDVGSNPKYGIRFRIFSLSSMKVCWVKQLISLAWSFSLLFLCIREGHSSAFCPWMPRLHFGLLPDWKLSGTSKPQNI